jgi:flagellar protein FlaG
LESDVVTPIQNISSIAVQPFDEVQTNLNEQSKTLKQERFNDIFTALSEKIKSKEKKDEDKYKENLAITDFKDLSEKLSSILEDESLKIEFSLDKDTNKMILKLIDSKTKEVIQQYPPEIALKIARIVNMYLNNE